LCIFPSLSFPGRILSINTSNDAFSAKDVPFAMRVFEFDILLTYSQTSKKYNGAYGDNLKIL